MISKRPVLILLIGLFLVKIDCLNFDQELEIDTLVTSFMTQNKIPGIGVTIVQNSEDSTFTRGYGYANMQNNIPANEDTKFCIASITKTFTATLVMKVLSETFPELGSAVLDTPLRILNPNSTFMFSDRFRYETMSFRDLLSHRVGVQTESLGSSAGAIKDTEEFIFRSRYAPETSSFRAGGFYSNPLYSLAGQMIAEIADEPYEILLQNFFNQLGMNDSIMIDGDTNYNLVENMSRGYFLYYGDTRPLNMSLINRISIGVAAGGIITTPNDMTKYISFHLNNGRVGDEQIVSEDALMWMRESAAPLDLIQFRTANSTLIAGSYAMGSGFQLNIFDGWQYLSHNGQWTTFLSQLRIYPELGFGTFTVSNGAVNLWNSTYGDHSFLQNSIFAIVYGLGTDPEELMTRSDANEKCGEEILLNHLAKHPSSPLKNISEESYVGNFGNPVEGNIEITFENGILYFQYGTWATGYLNQHPTYDMYYVVWTSDFVHDIYFAVGGFVDIFVQFEDSDTLNLIVGPVFTFRRGVSLDTLPIIPWEPESCAPQLPENPERSQN